MERRMRLLIQNVPSSCQDSSLVQWIEARGYGVCRITIVRDFAYVQLKDESRLDEAARTLNGSTLDDQPVRVKRVVQKSAIVRPAWM